jgi:uncharacterized SAM-binding protein YcdF (DUF218 family)
MTHSMSAAAAEMPPATQPGPVLVSPEVPDLVARRNGRRRWMRVLQVGLLAGGVVAAAAWQHRTAPLEALGAALVHEDGLRRAADVAVVSLANPRGAALDAAKLHRRGLAREVWIPRWRDERAGCRADALGVRVPRHHEVARAILERAGVPSSAIVVLDDPVSGLESEMASVGRALRAHPALRPVVLTQRSHTARARVLLRDVYAPAAQARVRAVRTDPFDPSTWWRERATTREVLLEYMKWAKLLASGPQVR